ELAGAGAMVRAETDLHEPPFGGGVIAISGGTVQPHVGWGQFVDGDGLLPERGFERFPGRALPETVEEQAEAIIRELRGARGLAQELLEGEGVTVSPLLTVRLVVIALRENERQPDRREPAVREPLVIAMLAQMLIEQVGELEVLHQPQEQGQVVDSFVSKRK